VKFITKLWTSCLWNWILERKAATELGSEYSEDRERDAKKARGTFHIPVTDVHSVATLFTVIALCWDGIKEDLEDSSNQPLLVVSIPFSAFLIWAVSFPKV
jgi:hypothetical protein